MPGAAAEALELMEIELLAEGLQTAMSHKNGFVRRKAAKVIGYYSTIAAEKELKRLVESDPRQPGRQSCLAAERGEIRKRADVGLLYDVLGFRVVAQDRSRHAEEALVVPPDEDTDGLIVALSDELHERLVWWANCVGVTGAPFDSYLTLRGLRTLHARLRVHAENAALVAHLLTGHPAVRHVHYPGLRSHPQHELARSQQSGFGGMLSFELHGGIGNVRAFLDGLRCFSLAESLGGVESLVAHPATMTHAAMDAEARRVAGISDSLLRLSIGIEAADDLIRDLHGGLERAAGVQQRRVAAEPEARRLEFC